MENKLLKVLLDKLASLSEHKMQITSTLKPSRDLVLISKPFSSRNSLTIYPKIEFKRFVPNTALLSDVNKRRLPITQVTPELLLKLMLPIQLKKKLLALSRSSIWTVS